MAPAVGLQMALAQMTTAVDQMAPAAPNLTTADVLTAADEHGTTGSRCCSVAVV